RLAINVRTLVTEDSNVVLANIYQLKINPLEVKTKADIIMKQINPEIDTRTFQLELEEVVEKPQVNIIPKKIKKRTQRKMQEEKGPEKNEALQMIIGFIVILGFALYQAFGE